MLRLQPEVWSRGGKKEFVILPYEQYQELCERLEDAVDFRLLEESKRRQLEQILGRLTPQEVRVVEDRSDLAPRALLLLARRLEIPSQHLDERRAGLFGDNVDEVERIHVRASTFQVLRDLLTAHEQKPSGLVDLRRVLTRSAETHTQRIARAAFLDR